MICSTCGKEFEAKRKDKRFCSPACRLKAHRNVSETDSETFHQSVSDETDNVTVSVTKVENANSAVILALNDRIKVLEKENARLRAELGASKDKKPYQPRGKAEVTSSLVNMDAVRERLSRWG